MPVINLKYCNYSIRNLFGCSLIRARPTVFIQFSNSIKGLLVSLDGLIMSNFACFHLRYRHKTETAHLKNLIINVLIYDKILL